MGTPQTAFALVFLVLGVPASAAAPPGERQAPDPPYEIPDPAGDVFPALGPAVGLPPTPLTSAVDLTSLRVAIDAEDWFVVEFRVVDASPVWSLRNVPYARPHYWLEFQIPTNGTVTRYVTTLFTPFTGQFIIGGTNVPVQPPSLRMNTQLCVSNEDYRCFEQPAFATLTFATNTIQIRYPKSSLLGMAAGPTHFPAARPASLPTHLDPGTPVRFKALSSHGAGQAAQDLIPNPGAPAPPDYLFARAAANTRIRLAVDGAGARATQFYGYGGFQAGSPENDTTVTASPERPAVVPILVHNTQPAKRLVRLTAEFPEWGAEARWKIQLAPSVEVPAGESRTVNLIIEGAKDLAHRDAAQLVVRGRSLVHETEVGIVRLELTWALAPGPTRPSLFFHATDPPDATGNPPALYWLNTLETDPAATGDAEAMPNPWNGFELDSALARDFVFDTTKPISATVRLVSPAPLTASVRLRLEVGQTFLGDQTREVSIGTAPTAVAFDIPLHAVHERIPAASGRIRAHLAVRPPDASQQNLVGSVYNQVRVVPQGSSLELPLVPDPLDRPQHRGPRIFVLYPLGSPEEFVNPGRTRMFNAILAHEGLEADQASLEANVNGTGWSVEIRPATRFQLDPSQSVNLSLLIVAPGSAEDGDRAEIVLTAASNRDPRSIAEAAFRLTAVTQVEIPDDRERYRDDPEAAKHAVRDAPASTPGLGVLALLLACLGVLTARRRA